MHRVLVFACLASAALHAADRQILAIADLPGVSEWKDTPASSKMEDGRLTIAAGGSTDWFISPLNGESHTNAPLLLFEPAEDFVLTAKLDVEFGTPWDAGLLMVYADDTHWAKLALEMSVYGEPTIVTVVTRGVSDDCNSAPVRGGSIWYRIAKTGPAIAFYASPDGRSWKMVRAFSLGASPGLRVGFGAQSPAGNKGSATFSEIRYGARKIRDIFKGE